MSMITVEVRAKKWICGIVMILMSVTPMAFLYGQSDANVPELKWKLNEDGSQYIKGTFLNQVWLRYNQSNTGTTVMGEPASQTLDIGLRRTRLQFFGQLTDKFFFYTQFGQNNFNYLSQQAGNRKLQAFFHDALGEYKIWRTNDHLKLGAGLTITNGLSRFSQPSVSSIMTMDVPVFAQATVDQTDEFSRKLSVYARGQLGKTEYRLVLSDPFPISTNGQAVPQLRPEATFTTQGHHKQYQGFFMYNFFEKEPHTTPYMTGTYLGKKRIFNVEAGFILQKNATWTQEMVGSDTLFHPMKLWSVALYYDAPLNTDKGTALSAYAGYFNFNYGPNYLRYNGIMNPANGGLNAPYAGSHGNAFPMFGTGSVMYTQLGYLLKKNLLREAGTLMPYVSLMYADYQRLKDAMSVMNVGVNWLMKSHNTKITLDYQVRPVYKTVGEDLEKSSDKGQVVLQYQIFI
jgi:hypothetical protein